MSTETVWNRRLACVGARRSSSAVWHEIKVAIVNRAELNACPFSVRYHTSSLFSINVRAAIKLSQVWFKLTSFISALLIRSDTKKTGTSEKPNKN